MAKNLENSYYKAVVVECPQSQPYGLLSVGVRLSDKRFTANFSDSNIQAVSLMPGDEVWICPFTGDVGPIVKHNSLVRFFKRLLN